MLPLAPLLALALADGPPDGAPRADRLPDVDALLVDEPLDLDTPAPEPPPEPPAEARWPRYELAFRGRYVSIPRGILDAWYTDDHLEGWPLTTGRPFPKAGAYGLDVSIYGPKSNLALFYVEVLQSFTAEGYWDDHDEPEIFGDGDWLRPSRFFGAVVLGANGLYDVPIVRPEQTNGWFRMSFQVGGGLGIGILVGHVDRWALDTTHGTPAYLRLEQAPERADLKSPVWPVPDLHLGFKFLFADHVVLRLEAGVHGGFFYGGSLGGRF